MPRTEHTHITPHHTKPRHNRPEDNTRAGDRSIYHANEQTHPSLEVLLGEAVEVAVDDLASLRRRAVEVHRHPLQRQGTKTQANA